MKGTRLGLRTASCSLGVAIDVSSLTGSSLLPGLLQGAGDGASKKPLALEPIVWAGEEARHRKDQAGKGEILLASRSCRELRESITLLLYSPSGPGATAQLCPLEQAPTLRATWGQQPCPKRYCNQVFLSPYGLAASKRGHSAPSSAAEVSCLPPALVFQGHRSLADTSLELSSSYKKGRLTTLSTYRDHLAHCRWSASPKGTCQPRARVSTHFSVSPSIT